MKNIDRANQLRRLNIIYDVAFPFVEGGGQRRIYEIARRLSKRGWTVKWYCFKTWYGADVIQRDGIEYIGLNGSVPLYDENGKRSVVEALRFGQAVWKNRKLIRSADIIWCGQWPYLHLFSILGSIQARIVVDWWETWGVGWFRYGKFIAGFAGFLLERLLAKICSRRGIIVAISGVGERQLINIGASRNNLKVIPNGFDSSKVISRSEGHKRCDLLYVGRLQSHKNVKDIVTAVRYLKDKYGRVCRAIIAGDGPELATLESYVKKMQLRSEVKLLGSVTDEEKYSLMTDALLFVHPSTKEGGGSITVVEALACGTPVLIYDTPGGIDPSYIEHRRTGWLVKPTSAAALAQCIAGIFANGDLVGPNSDKACRQAALKYSWDNICNQYESVFLS